MDDRKYVNIAVSEQKGSSMNVNKKRDYINRYLHWCRNGYSHEEAKKMAISDMISCGLIKSEEEIFNESTL